MRRRVTFLMSTLLSIGALLTTAYLIAGQAKIPPRDVPPATAASQPGQNAISRSVPSLSAVQQQQAASLVQSDPRVKRLTQGVSTQVKDVVVWTKTSGEVIGALVTVNFSRPVTVSGQWMSLTYDQSEKSIPPYVSTSYEVTYNNVTGLLIDVDLERQQIVSVDPSRGSQVVGTPVVPVGVTFPTRPAGTPQGTLYVTVTPAKP